MKRQDFTEIKQLEVKAILAKVLAAKTELTDLVVDKSQSKLKDVKILAKRKKDIAQMLTIIRQKQLLEELESVVASTAKQSKSDERSSSVNKVPKKIAASPKAPRNDKKGSKK